MKGILCLCVPLMGLSVFTVGCSGSVEPARIPNGANADEPAAESVSPAPDRQPHTLDGCVGVVAAVGGDWVEIGPGWEGMRVDDVRRWTDEQSQKSKRIPAEDIPSKVRPDPSGLAVASEPFLGETHRLSDLRIGDRVMVWIGANRAGDQWAMRIGIIRRPGGQIPPMYGDRAVGTEHASHLREQAEQDWEEKGTPIPKKYLNPQGRAPWTNPPYPPVAPEPRPAKAKP